MNGLRPLNPKRDRSFTPSIWPRCNNVIYLGIHYCILEGAWAEARWRCRWCWKDEQRVLSALEGVPPEMLTAPSPFTFSYSSKNCPWIISLPASLLATENTQPKAGEEMRSIPENTRLTHASPGPCLPPQRKAQRRMHNQRDTCIPEKTF